MPRSRTKLEEAAVRVYCLWMQGRVLAQDDEAALLFNGFLGEAGKIPGTRKKIMEVLRKSQEEKGFR